MSRKIAFRGQDIFRIMINRLPWHIGTEDLFSHFRPYGPIQNAYVPFDKTTGFHKGYGFITFSNFRSAEKALLQEHILGNKKLRVTTALKRK
ncbi:hypothetical protein LOTGIDRAFT_221127 [Lottia gigantea]|uniref:RRM domain-containing protein n=1 Tax=Lottia gigantea TaxID=225164 RepID=V4BAF4_LOTGI|nr:hypothetical protein LOTGIDRAFT_221127 [Lottia gigantea]ESO85929.1 hypothetical protein LOTGIDRAFT_221127 [Lottia gigantea]